MQSQCLTVCKVRHERMNHVSRMNFPITTHDLKTCRAKLHPVQTKPDTNPESPNRLPTGRRGFKPCQTLQSFSNLFRAKLTHSGVLAWRIPGTAEPGGLPSTGSHRVGHDQSNLAAAAATYPSDRLQCTAP